jgi:hypothetical protein
MNEIREEIEKALSNRGRRVLFAWTLLRIGGYSGDKNELAAELVSEAVQRVLSGKRVWNREGTEDALDFLASVIRSLISGFRKKYPEQFKPAITPEDAEILGLLRPKVLEIEEKMDLESFVTELIAELQGDPQLLTVFERVVFGGEEPKAVAASLDLQPSEIYAVRKRLNRKIQALYERREMIAV